MFINLKEQKILFYKTSFHQFSNMASSGLQKMLTFNTRDPLTAVPYGIFDSSSQLSLLL